jgi:hypothetical protein
MIFGLLEAVIDFLTLRSSVKKKPAEMEAEMKSGYARTKEARQLDALAAAAHPQRSSGSAPSQSSDSGND